MGVILNTLNFCLLFFIAACFLEFAGMGIFSRGLFTHFGALFFFLAFLNEFCAISLG